MIDLKGKGDEIFQYIFDDYIFNRDLSPANSVLQQLDLLIENKLAVKITGHAYLYSSSLNIQYNVASQLMVKHNKDLKKCFRRLSHNTRSGGIKIFADDNPELIKISSYVLDCGTYSVVLKDSDYAILIVNEDPDDRNYSIEYELYFVGKHCNKWKNKYFDKVNKYEQIRDSSRDEIISYSERHKQQKIVKFKSFDDMVFKDKEKYIKYIDNWVSNIPTYYKRGVPAKLSILMYGKPGTGKSSFYKALAKYLDIQDVCCISASYFTDPGNNNLRFGSKYAYPVVYALDDIDCVCNSRKNDKSLKNSQIVSSLLEFLDNPPGCYYKASDGVFYPVSIIVATTNYYDDLDEAVKRYGRFDLQIEMTDFDANEAEEMCHLYDLALSDIIHEKIKDDFTISPAKLQALCVENIDSHLKEMKTEV